LRQPRARDSQKKQLLGAAAAAAAAAAADAAAAPHIQLASEQNGSSRLHQTKTPAPPLPPVTVEELEAGVHVIVLQFVGDVIVLHFAVDTCDSVTHFH